MPWILWKKKKYLKKKNKKKKSNMYQKSSCDELAALECLPCNHIPSSTYRPCSLFSCNIDHFASGTNMVVLPVVPVRVHFKTASKNTRHTIYIHQYFNYLTMSSVSYISTTWLRRQSAKTPSHSALTTYSQIILKIRNNLLKKQIKKKNIEHL